MFQNASLNKLLVYNFIKQPYFLKKIFLKLNETTSLEWVKFNVYYYNLSHCNPFLSFIQFLINISIKGLFVYV